MKPDFKKFTEELLNEYWEYGTTDLDADFIQELLVNNHIIKEVPASDEYKSDWGEENETMFVRNYE